MLALLLLLLLPLRIVTVAVTVISTVDISILAVTVKQWNCAKLTQLILRERVDTMLLIIIGVLLCHANK